jgi:hypothetical protein
MLPPEGFQSRIALRASILRLVEHGAIDPAKMEARYEAPR